MPTQRCCCIQTPDCPGLLVVLILPFGLLKELARRQTVDTFGRFRVCFATGSSPHPLASYVHVSGIDVKHCEGHVARLRCSAAPASSPQRRHRPLKRTGD